MKNMLKALENGEESALNSPGLATSSWGSIVSYLKRG
jgi:hypothetical protein